MSGLERVVIFGATSSVAADVARLLAASGSHLYLVGRSEEKLGALQKELGAQVLGTEAYDFTDTSRATSTVQRAVESLGGLDLALLAHGYLGDQLASECEFSEAQKLIEVNFSSAVALVLALANCFEQMGAGHIAAITSVAGDRGRPRNYTYGAAKGALGLYLQGVRSRLYPRVSVTNLKLGPVDTPMTIGHEKNALFASSPQAARGIVSALRRRKKQAYVPGFWRAIMFAVVRLPEFLFQRFAFLSGR